MAAGGNSANIALGAGRLWVASVGTAEPADCSTALPSAWLPIGYTEDGTTLAFDLTNEPILVAEEFDPVRYVLSARSTKLSVKMAEITRFRIGLAFGVFNSLDSAASFEPPEPGAEVAVKLVWDSDETASAANRRWLFRQAKVNGTVEMQRNKAPNKALLPVEFNMEKPASGAAPWKAFPNSLGEL